MCNTKRLCCAQTVEISSPNSEVTGHYLRWCMPPFMRQCWGLLHKLAQCTRPQGWGKLVNAALLSLINEECVNVCCATLLLSQLVGPACVQARSSNPRGRACGPSGKGSGEDGILSGVVPVYLYCPAFNVRLCCAQTVEISSPNSEVTQPLKNAVMSE